MKLLQIETIRRVRVGTYRCACGLKTRALTADVQETNGVRSCGHRHASADLRLLFQRRLGITLTEEDLSKVVL